MTLKTIQQYANEKGTSQQNVRQSKKIPFVKLDTFVEYQGVKIKIGEQTFIECENNSPDNQTVVK